MLAKYIFTGIADSAFYAGEFLTSSRYLDQLHQRNRGTVHTYLLQTETSIYLGKPTSVITQHLERFSLEMAILMAKLSATHSRYIRKHMPEISLYHMLRWAVELGRSNRLYGAIFVCRSLSLLPALHRNRVRQFDLTYGLFIEIALRIMNVLHQDGIALGNVLIECLDSAFRMLLDRAQVLHPLASAFEWNRLVACSNTVAFLSNITGDYDKVSRRVKWGLNAIAKYLHPRTILYADLKVNEAVMCLKTWKFEAAVRCYEEASRVYRSCVELDSHRMEMVERARRALALAKKLRDVKEETPRSKKVYSLSQCPRHIAFHKNHKTKSAHQLLGQWTPGWWLIKASKTIWIICTVRRKPDLFDLIQRSSW